MPTSRALVLSKTETRLFLERAGLLQYSVLMNRQIGSASNAKHSVEYGNFKQVEIFPCDFKTSTKTQ